MYELWFSEIMLLVMQSFLQRNIGLWWLHFTMKSKRRKTSTQLKNVYALTQDAQLVNFSSAAQLCFSLHVPCLCNDSEFHQVVPGGRGLVVFGLAAHWYHSGVCSPSQHLPPCPLANTRAGGAGMPLSNPSSNVNGKQEVRMLHPGETAGSTCRSELELSKLLLSDHWHSHTAVQMKAAVQ